MNAELPLLFTVPPSLAGARLDLFLHTTHPALSRGRFQALIHEGLVLVDGFPRKPSHVLRGGERVTVTVPPPRPSEITPENIPLRILFEDVALLVLDKPPGLVVHPAPGHGSGTLVHALVHHLPGLPGIGGVERPGIVHRLDKDTSGVLVVAKTQAAHVELTRRFAAREVQKTYLALVHGEVREKTGRVDVPIGRHPLRRKKMQAAEGQARSAVTLWKTRESRPRASFLELALLTGRTHQARVHCAYMGHPVLGDPLYGGRHARAALPPGCPAPARQMLHAFRIAFAHPLSGAPLAFEAPVPPDMEALARAFFAV
jgi:23S rRNA pseudouridine1911/1915/1917 synthase